MYKTKLLSPKFYVGSDYMFIKYRNGPSMGLERQNIRPVPTIHKLMIQSSIQSYSNLIEVFTRCGFK